MADTLFIVDESGTVRHLGNRTPIQGMKESWTVYGDTINAPMVKRSEWTAHCLDASSVLSYWGLDYVHNQNGYGMCNASATSSAMESQRKKQGLPSVKISAGDLYHRIAIGGRDSGSLLEDGIRVAMSEGVASVNVVPYLDWQNPHQEAAADRKRFRVIEAFLCPTFDHCMSAVIMGFDLISGIMWYSNYTPDSDGWLPSGRGNAGGHAVHGFAPACRNGRFGIWHKNSWGQWGMGGRGLCVFPESAYAGPVGGWWAVRSMVDEGGVVPPSE